MKQKVIRESYDSSTVHESRSVRATLRGRPQSSSGWRAPRGRPHRAVPTDSVTAALGEFPELSARGVPPTGTENFGGSIVTAGGLVFIGATMDEKFHAFDKSTGKLLWEHKLDAGGYATPSTYSRGNRQFVVIAAGGGGKLRTKSGDEFVAFALPEK